MPNTGTPNTGTDVRPRDGPARLQRQFGVALAELLRPGTYLGAARETLFALVHAAVHPLGLLSVEALQDALEAERAVEAIDQRLAPSTAAMPIVLLHGYVMNHSAFLVMRQALTEAGFRHVRAFNYPQFTHGVPEIARMLKTEVERVLEVAGAERCSIVGHSLGGIVARYYAQVLGGEKTLDTIVTLGTPHMGTYAAHFGVGPVAMQVTYQSPFLNELTRTARPSSVRYISYYSDLDLFVVPAISAKLTEPALQATNIRVRDIGHLSMLLSGEVVQSVVDYLAHPERSRPTTNSLIE